MLSRNLPAVLAIISTLLLSLAISLPLDVVDKRDGCDADAYHFGNVTLCNCFNKGLALDRSELMDALYSACQSFSNYTWGIGGWAVDVKKWIPNHHNCNNGVMCHKTLVRLQWIGGSDCTAPTSLHFDTCWAGFHTPIDLCTMEAENNKQGGVALGGCFRWTVDPDAAKNDPGLIIPSI